MEPLKDSRPPQPGFLFAEPQIERRFPLMAVAVAAVAAAVLVAGLVWMGRRNGAAPLPTTLQPEAAYGSNLVLENLQMSESTSFSGGKSTYIDGHLANRGTATVTGITVQVLFANDEAMPPQIETVPVNLIRMREPYIDTEPVSAAPLRPGAEADFRLIFEGIESNWNQQSPVVRVIRVSTK